MYLIGLDVGTSGVKGVLISREGSLIASQTRSYPLSTPRPGWTEQQPADWWQAVLEVLQGIIRESGVDTNRVAGLSLSGQMHSAVFLDEDMKVIRPAILWSDTRTGSQCREIYRRVGGLTALSGLVSNPALEGFTAPKILWLRENEPDNFKKVRLVLLPKDYIRYLLTGEIQTEVSDGAGTLLLDVQRKDWSREMLTKLELSGEILPPVVDSITVTGGIRDEVALLTGLKPGTPVIAGGADNACGAVGSGIIKPGRVMISIGSSGVVLAQVDRPVADRGGRIHLFNHALPDSWYMMGVMLSAGFSLSWLKDKLFDGRLDYSRLNQLAAGVEPGSAGLVFLPYLYGERTPHADAAARGVFFGINGKHEQRHFIRSVLEGVGFGLRDSLELIKKQGLAVDEVRVIGGGARSRVWQQLLAEVLGHELSLLNIEEGPALGAALIAAVGTGVYSSFQEAEERVIRIKSRVEPLIDNVVIYDKYYRIYQDLYPALREDFQNLAGIDQARHKETDR